MKTLFSIFAFLFFISFANLLNAQVALKWVARYNNNYNLDDEAHAIAVDNSGNVYVTGFTKDIAGEDYYTIKYNSSGFQQWAVRYTSSNITTDIPRAIAVDNSGNVYVTGQCEASSFINFDYCTIKYNSSGVQQWVAIYSNSAHEGDDVAYSIALDTYGNIYVTGESDDLHPEYCTIKYNPSGVQQWVMKYSSAYASTARSIAVDNSGMVYVTGSSSPGSTGWDYCTIKYNNSGVIQWLARYNGPGNSTDSASSMVLDVSGNVYVTGSSTGNGSNVDYATIKYNSSGIQQWAARYNGPGDSSDEAYSMALDASGNVYVTGKSIGEGNNYDYATIKYNPSGVLQCAVRYNGPANSNDGARSILLDYSGNVYVTGGSTGISTSYDYATIKYNSSLMQQWLIRYNAANGNDVATSMAVDMYGGVYVTGYSFGNGPLYDYGTIKYVQMPPAPSLVYPLNNSINNSLTPLLDWTDVPVADSFRVQVSTDSGFSTIFINKAGITASQYQVLINTLQNNIIYYWRVSSVNTVGVSPWSSVWNFRTSPIGIKPISSEIPNEYRLYENFPNPFNPSTNIRFDLPKAGYVKLSIFDLLGREVDILTSEKLNAGSYKIDWNAGNFPSGIYFYKLQTESFSDTKKMILLK